MGGALIRCSSIPLAPTVALVPLVPPAPLALYTLPAPLTPFVYRASGASGRGCTSGASGTSDESAWRGRLHFLAPSLPRSHRAGGANDSASSNRSTRPVPYTCYRSILLPIAAAHVARVGERRERREWRGRL